MRHILAALALIFCAFAAHAFEVEEEQAFPGAMPGQDLSIISTTDTAFFAPILRAFQTRYPGISIRYTVTGSVPLYTALAEEGAVFDLAISSAMDLQMKLANDGLARPHRVAAILPDWAQWQDQLFSFAQEPVVLIVSRRAFAGLALPRTRRDLITLLRDHPGRFIGRLGTYDPRLSGAGYLFATQEARQSDSFWRLAEVMGTNLPRLYTSSTAMLDDLENGTLALAHNVLGSYSSSRLGKGSDLAVIEFEDFTLSLLRTALIPKQAQNPALAGLFIDFLLSPEGRDLNAREAGLPPVDEAALVDNPRLRPIRLDPGLLVYLDQMKRRAFLEEWSAAMEQR
ncbi:MAG: ABC transporter substrate-binding protein [Paracoccaceae bacterium]|nr:ABC transporter substrate-binding protein [Paracoccaceae bacterium]